VTSIDVPVSPVAPDGNLNQLGALSGSRQRCFRIVEHMKRTTKIITASLAAVTVAVGAGTAYAVATDDPDSVTGDDLQRAIDAARSETGGGTILDVEHDDGGYDVEVRLDDGAEVDVSLGADFTVVSTETDNPDDGASDEDDDDLPLEATERQRVADAALASTDGGTVTDVEHDLDGYEVEILLDDGTEIDVALADDLTVIHTASD
jgi:uncharacterized membrane protein YkoI